MKSDITSGTVNAQGNRMCLASVVASSSMIYGRGTTSASKVLFVDSSSTFKYMSKDYEKFSHNVMQQSIATISIT